MYSTKSKIMCMCRTHVRYLDFNLKLDFRLSHSFTVSHVSRFEQKAPVWPQIQTWISCAGQVSSTKQENPSETRNLAKKKEKTDCHDAKRSLFAPGRARSA